MISNCGHDENNKYSGGKAGDQTGGEWAVIEWYSRPWNVVLRHPDEKVRALIAQLAQKCAENDHIGYDQDSSNGNDAGRYSFWTQLKAVKYDPTKIKTNCETDCSGGVAAIIKAVGYLLGDAKLQNISIYCYTGNLRKALVAAGFTALTDSKYLSGDEYLYAGDILLYEGHHVATNLTNGKKCGTTESKTDTKTGWIKSGNTWYYRVSPGVNAHGWKDIKTADGKTRRFYFDTKGAMATDWQKISEKWYYFQPSGDLAGAMYVSDNAGVQTIWEK